MTTNSSFVPRVNAPRAPLVDASSPSSRLASPSPSPSPVSSRDASKTSSHSNTRARDTAHGRGFVDDLPVDVFTPSPGDDVPLSLARGRVPDRTRRAGPRRLDTSRRRRRADARANDADASHAGVATARTVVRARMPPSSTHRARPNDAVSARRASCRREAPRGVARASSAPSARSRSFSSRASSSRSRALGRAASRARAMGTRARPSPSRRRRRRDASRETFDAGRRRRRRRPRTRTRRGTRRRWTTVPTARRGTMIGVVAAALRTNRRRGRAWARIRDDGARFERLCERRLVRT